MNLIGLDCAVEPKKCGLAIGSNIGNRLTVREVKVGLSESHIIDLICKIIRENGQTLMAIDSPLGWPQALGNSLIDHKAGMTIESNDNFLFRRETDRFIREKIEIQSLDVGADKIARTALATLKRLNQIRSKSNHEIPLSWNPDVIKIPSCIEVYPAATLKAWEIPPRGYRGNEPRHYDARINIIKKLKAFIELAPATIKAMENCDHAIDAVICLLAAHDFVCRRSLPPKDPNIAHKEGWIWVKPKMR